MTWRLAGTSIATRLALALVGVTVVSLLVTSLVGLDSGDELTGERTRARLDAVRSSRAIAIESYVSSLDRRVEQLASTPMTVDAVQRFTEAYAELGATIDDDELDAVRVDLFDRYAADLIPSLEAARGRAVEVTSIFPAAPQGAYLQSTYLTAAEDVGVVPAVIGDARDGSAWTDVHIELHPRYRDIARRLEVEDLLLIDAESATIVYTVGKGPDTGTSLELGPYSGASLAGLVDQVLADPDSGIVFADFATYGAAGDVPTMFVGSAVVDDGRVIGVLVLRLSADEIARLATGEERWESVGLGESGEVYVVASDGRMRSESRAFLEDPGAYLDAVTVAGTTTEADRRRIEASGTTVSFQRVDLDGIEESVAEDDAVSSTNYLGVDSATLASQLELPGSLTWAIVSEISVEELEAPVEDLRRLFLVAIAVIVVAVTFLAVAWANRSVLPIRRIGERLRRAERSTEIAEHEQTEMPRRTPEEFRLLAERFERMVDALRDRRRAVAAASAERLDVLRRLLPPGVARRVERGDRQVLDVVPQATVTVVVIRGLGDVVRSGTPEQRGSLARLVDAMDALAAQHGVERIKLAGDAWFGASGIGRPYLDHAPRATAFVLAAREAAADIDHELDVDLQVSAGLASGPVSVGLAGASRLVYDAWGVTPGAAHFLARSAQPGQLLASASTRALLPDTIELADHGEIDGHAVAVILGELDPEVTT